MIDLVTKFDDGGVSIVWNAMIFQVLTLVESLGGIGSESWTKLGCSMASRLMC